MIQPKRIFLGNQSLFSWWIVVGMVKHFLIHWRCLIKSGTSWVQVCFHLTTKTYPEPQSSLHADESYVESNLTIEWSKSYGIRNYKLGRSWGSEMTRKTEIIVVWFILSFKVFKMELKRMKWAYSLLFISDWWIPLSFFASLSFTQLSKRAIRIKQAWKARAEGKPNPNAPIASTQRKNASGNQQKPKHSGGIQGGDLSTRGKFVTLPSMPVPGTMACRLKRI